jgi:hypothetical protein
MKRSGFKKRFSNLFILSIPFLILLISGCTIPLLNIDIPWFNGDVSYENDIIIIKSLEAVPVEISPGQTTKIIGYIENKGSEPIEGVTVELYDYCPGVLKPMGDEAIPIDKLLPKEIKQITWRLKAEDIKLRTICPKDGVKVRVTYHYETNSETTISFMDASEMQRRIEEGKFKTKQSYTVLGEGPVKPVLKVEDVQPISTDSGKTAVSLKIENRGNGFVKDSTVQVEDVKGSPDSNLASEIWQCLEERNSTTIRLIRKESPKIICQEINIPQKATGQIDYTEYITVKIKYDYEFRRNVVVIVKPKV